MIERQNTIETYRFLAYEERTQRNILLHSAACTDTNDLQLAFLLFLRSGVIIDIRQRVNLVHHDIAVICTYTGWDTTDTFAMILTGDGMELTTLNVALNRTFIEERSYNVYTVLVTHQNNLVCQELRFQM